MSDEDPEIHRAFSLREARLPSPGSSRMGRTASGFLSLLPSDVAGDQESGNAKKERGRWDVHPLGLLVEYLPYLACE